jgi:flagellar motor protein MotB
MWGRALNLGPVINTRGNEVSPFVHPVFKVLYFSSNGHLLNFGDFDIYKTYFRNGQWTEPYNIGPLVNGKGSEYYFTIDKEARRLYYARSDSNDLKNLNLYSFPLPMEAQPLATTSFSGTITDSSGKPLEGVVTVIDLDNGIEVVPKFVRPDGSFDFNLINQNNYLLVIQGDDFFRIEKMFFLAGDTSINTQASTIKSQKITFTSIEFEGGSSEIAEIMHPDLDKVMNFLIDHPEVNLNISGHTDQTGDLEANLKLSQDRANAIKQYLTASGYVATERILAKGFGSQRPIIPQELNERDRRMNRRVEFEIVIPEGPVRPTRKRLN